MLDWISKKRKEEKQKQRREEELKKSLSAKLAKYQEKLQEPVDDHTELLLNGKKIRVAKEQITLEES